MPAPQVLKKSNYDKFNYICLLTYELFIYYQKKNDMFRGAQDGGAGSFGDVMEIQDWKGKSGAGILVKWRSNGFEGLYRWDYRGAFDLKVIDSPNKYSNPITLPSKSVKVSVVSESGTSSSLYGLKLIVKPTYSIYQACKLPGFRSDLERVRSEYTVGSMAHDIALVNYIDKISLSKGYLICI